MALLRIFGRSQTGTAGSSGDRWTEQFIEDFDDFLVTSNIKDDYLPVLVEMRFTDPYRYQLLDWAVPRC